MKRTINVYEFRDAFRDMGRSDSFSYEGLEVLFDWFEEYADDSGQEVELDVISICCEFSEEHYTDIASNYNLDLNGLDSDEGADMVTDYLSEYGAGYCGILADNETILYQQF
jgi:hypothetical protein